MEWERLAGQFKEIADRRSDIRLAITEHGGGVSVQVFADWNSVDVDEFTRLAGYVGRQLNGGGDGDEGRWYRRLVEQRSGLRENTSAPAAISGFPDLRTFDIRDAARVSAGLAAELADEAAAATAADANHRKMKERYAKMIATANNTNGPPNPTKLAPRFEMAYRSFEFAEKKLERELTDREGFEWLQEEGMPDYELPLDMDTWERYLRAGREFHHAQKNAPRAGRSGRSIANPDDFQSRQDGD